MKKVRRHTVQKSLYGERACEVVYSVGERLAGFHEQLVAPVQDRMSREDTHGGGRTWTQGGLRTRQRLLLTALIYTHAKHVHE